MILRRNQPIGRLHHVATAIALAVCGPLAVSQASEHAAEHESPPASSKEAAASSDFKFRGIEMGEFRIRAYYPVEGQKSTVTFALYAIVDRNAESEDLFEHRQHKLRDQVIVATRLVPLTEFDDPDLKSFRRRILLRIRRALPELSIDDVYVSDFNLAVESI